MQVEFFVVVCFVLHFLIFSYKGAKKHIGKRNEPTKNVVSGKVQTQPAPRKSSHRVSLLATGREWWGGGLSFTSIVPSHSSLGCLGLGERTEIFPRVMSQRRGMFVTQEQLTLPTVSSCVRHSSIYSSIFLSVPAHGGMFYLCMFSFARIIATEKHTSIKVCVFEIVNTIKFSMHRIFIST